MIANEVINMAHQCGAKVFTKDGETKIVIADNGASGDGTEFIHKFARAIEICVYNQNHNFPKPFEYETTDFIGDGKV